MRFLLNQIHLTGLPVAQYKKGIVTIPITLTIQREYFSL